ncbi:MAG TPA: Gfo/Idh/MocA family oxidoreductase, partial [Vicinamibacteria bacterium]|nr:Gfo/Idh/MocA family oxidoreductase [Vicinamibacteria bacterium]
MTSPDGPPTRVGVIGVGALGQHHARVYAALEGVRLAGVYDVDAARAGEVAERHGSRAYAHLRELLPEVDAVSVAVPTVDHLRVARAALDAGKDVLVEKPMATTLAEADEMIALAEARGAVLQVGHIERFNPAVEVLRRVPKPRFVEVHRLGSFSPRSLDIDVVLDLMIHDLDLVLSLDGTEAVQVDAVGVPVLTPRVDIANARLRFASGLIANLTASR